MVEKRKSDQEAECSYRPKVYKVAGFEKDNNCPATLLTINDKCLIHTFKYLSLRDLLYLGLVHNRFHLAIGKLLQDKNVYLFMEQSSRSNNQVIGNLHYGSDVITETIMSVNQYFCTHILNSYHDHLQGISVDIHNFQTKLSGSCSLIFELINTLEFDQLKFLRLVGCNSRSFASFSKPFKSLKTLLLKECFFFVTFLINKNLVEFSSKHYYSSRRARELK